MSPSILGLGLHGCMSRVELLTVHGLVTRPLDFHYASLDRSVTVAVRSLYKCLLTLSSFRRHHYGPFTSHVNIILCNLYRAYICMPGSWIRFARTPDRYRCVKRYHPFGCSFRHIIDVVDALRATGFIKYKPGYIDRLSSEGKQSIISASSKLSAWF